MQWNHPLDYPLRDSHVAGRWEGREESLSETGAANRLIGGNPDYSQCRRAISSGLPWFKDLRLGHLVNLKNIAKASMVIGSFSGRLRSD
jgi:hypothetical protein